MLGICAGLQMLGQTLIDPEHLDGAGAALGLLPLVTRFERDKTLRPVSQRLGSLEGCWAALSGLQITGYEIHHGQTTATGHGPGATPAHDTASALREVLPGLAWQGGPGQSHVLGIYLHGLFENPQVLTALFGGHAQPLDGVFSGLAEVLRQHVQPEVLQALVEPTVRDTGSVQARPA